MYRNIIGGAAATLVACAGPAETPSVIRTDSAGVEIVTSSERDHELRWSIERRFSLGGAEQGPEAFYAVSTNSVGVDDTGRIYVLDGAAHHVVVFSAEGEHLMTLGRAGNGPGEFASPGTLAVGSDGSVSVFDYGKGALVRFDVEGNPQSEVPFRFFPWPGPSRHIATSAQGVLVANMAPPPDEHTFRHALQLVAGSDTSVLAEHVFPRPGMVRYPSCGGGLNLPRIFEPPLLWESRGDRVAVARGTEYEIEVMEGRQLTRRVRRSLSVRPASEQAAIAELGEGFRINFGRGPCTIPPAEMVPGRGYAETVPWIDRVSMTPSGEIWVARKEVGSDGGGPIDVFDRSGAYLGTLPPETPFPLTFVTETSYLASETDEFDVMRLVLLEINR